MWIYKAQQIHKSAQGAVQNKHTLQYIQHNLQINYLIYKCNLIYKKNKTSAKTETKKKQLGKSLFHKMSFTRSLEMGQRRTIFDISRQSIPETRSSYWKRSIPPWMFWTRFAEQRHIFGTKHTRWVIWFEETCDILWRQIIKWFKNNE